MKTHTDTPPHSTEPHQSLETAAKDSRYRIVALMAGKSLDQRLSKLGLYLGAEIKLIHKRPGGAMVVAHGDTRIALGAGMACKIVVQKVHETLTGNYL
jgi:ferrous iron transport protein A